MQRKLYQEKKKKSSIHPTMIKTRTPPHRINSYF